MPGTTGPNRPHGTCTRYTNGGCRCAACTAAMTTYNTGARNDRILGRPRRVDITGTHRRITALMANGWPGTAIAEAAGVPLPIILRASRRGQPYISRRHATRIRATYEQIGYSIGPSTRTAARALASGWAVPEQWAGANIDDPDAEPRDDSDVTDLLDFQTRVAAACRGRLAYDQLTRTEGAAAIRRLHTAGLNDGDLARRLQGPVKTVGRRRMRMGLPANAEIGSNHSRSA